MIRVYLLRHGIAVPHGDPEYDDDDRPLTTAGARRMRQVARGLRRLGVRPDRIVSSPLPRAWRTAEIVARVLGLPDQLEEADALRAGRDAASIRAWLDTRPEPELMLVGHDPSLTDLVGLLVTGEPGPPLVELRRGGIVALSAPSGEGGMRIEWMARPRLLRRA